MTGFKPTSAADLPPAKEFARQCRDAYPMPITGLRLLRLAGIHERASDMLRALTDERIVVCVGPDKDCPKAYRGDLVGQLYSIPEPHHA